MFDSAVDKCFPQPVHNIASGPSAIVSRTHPPQLSAKAAQAIETAEKKFEADCASHVGRQHNPSAASSTSPASAPPEAPIASRLRSGDEGSGHEPQLEPKSQRKHPARVGGMTKQAVDERINAAIGSSEARIHGQLKRNHQAMMSAIAGINHDHSAKRPKVRASSVHCPH